MSRRRNIRDRGFRTPPGRQTVSWRWEVGLPLIVIGVLMAFMVAGASGGQPLFWTGVLLAGIGVAAFIRH